MKAALCKSLDGPAGVVVEEIADPVAGPGEAVVRVHAAALNFFDTLITRGKYQTKPDLPFSPGGEISGLVESLGHGVAGLAVGDRVAAAVGSGFACSFADPNRFAAFGCPFPGTYSTCRSFRDCRTPASH